MYFKVLMEMGHLGAGGAYEIVRYFEAEDALVLLTDLENYPGLKSKDLGTGIKLIQAVSKDDFEEWKKEDSNGFHHGRLYSRYPIGEQCILENRSSNGSIDSSLIAATLDYSKNGIGIKYGHKQLDKGTRLLLSVDSLKIIQKEAKVIWSNFYEGISISGLQWL